ncbi:MAG TPA: glycosyltransferase [Candidatus Sulfotelmatobacter sp.]|nr:glycosyltransferase [Candidatus Sulfotelmatobacter sp.]
MRPWVSVVVPTRRRPGLLRRCLGLLMAQDFESDAYEILVADDGADPKTERLVEALRAAARPRALRYIPVGDGQGPAAARNRAWRLAFGEIIAFTDDDCVPGMDWLRAGTARFEPGVAAVTGRVIVPLPRRPTDHEANTARLQEAEFATANCFCRRESLAAVGGFDERFRSTWREDNDLYFSLLEQEGRVVHAPQAVVVHPIRPAPWGISLRQQRNNFFEALLYKKHPALYRTRARRARPWLHYGASVAVATAAAATLAGAGELAIAVGLAWLALTGRLCYARLRETSRRPGHLLEMAVTSALIPPLALFWRAAGAVRHRVLFL